MKNKGYLLATVVLAVAMMADAHATLEQQLTTTHGILNNSLMKVIAGGGTLFGGIVAIVKGNFMLGLSILGCLILLSIGMSLINANITTLFG